LDNAEDGFARFVAGIRSSQYFQLCPISDLPTDRDVRPFVAQAAVSLKKWGSFLLVRICTRVITAVDFLRGEPSAVDDQR